MNHEINHKKTTYSSFLQNVISMNSIKYFFSAKTNIYMLQYNIYRESFIQLKRNHFEQNRNFN